MNFWLFILSVIYARFLLDIEKIAVIENRTFNLSLQTLCKIFIGIFKKDEIFVILHNQADQNML